MMNWTRRAIKVPLIARARWQSYRQTQPADTAPEPGIYFLIYHSVSGRLGLELDLDAALFQRQLHYLAGQSRVMPYDAALTRLAQGRTAAAPAPEPAPEPAVVLTFDDGYLDFYTTVYPLLQSLNLPATLFVTTGFVEERKPYPMLTHPDKPVEPVTWEMLGEMAASGLVTLGAHTHTHPLLTGAPPDRIEEELARPLDLFQARLGFKPRHFAYPRAEVDDTAAALARRYYASAAAGGGQPARASVFTSEAFDAYRLPRVPIRRSDGWWFFRAKLRGWLQAEEPFYAGLHALRQRLRP